MDTGSDASVHLSGRSAEQLSLLSTIKRIGKSQSGGTGDGVIHSQIVLLPRLSFGKEQLREVPMGYEEVSNQSAEPGGYLGMDILKRFNMVLDFQNDVAYLAPSSLVESPYRADGSNTRWRIAMVILAVIFLLMVVLWYRRRINIRRATRPA